MCIGVRNISALVARAIKGILWVDVRIILQQIRLKWNVILWTGHTHIKQVSI
jgi:hypothetical protein